MTSLAIALALFGQTAPAPAPAATGWTFRENSDPAKPKSASAVVHNAHGARLIVRCDTAKVPIISVQFFPNPEVPAGDPRTVTLTINEAQAEITSWLFPGRGAYNGEAGEVFPIVSEIAPAKTVRVAFADGEREISEDFVGPGGDAMFRKVYGVCGLPYAMPVVTPEEPKKK